MMRVGDDATAPIYMIIPGLGRLVSSGIWVNGDYDGSVVILSFWRIPPQ
jgi:hypothetical protein